MYSAPEEILDALPAGRPVLVLLDYDGTVVPFAPDPSLARPDPDLLSLLDRLDGHRDRRVVLVSGRSAEDLGRLFEHRPLRTLALHGAQYSEPGRPTLQRFDLAACRRLTPDILEACRPLLSIPGVRIEDKGAAVCLHTRACGPAEEAEAARRFRRIAAPFCEAGPFALLVGSRVLELRPRGADKGSGVRWLLERFPPPWVPLYLGDDLTDEDAFRSLTGRGATVAVGPPARVSAALFRLPDVAAARDLLRRLA